MNKSRYSNWEECKEDADLMRTASPSDAEPTGSCDVWGAHIETTLISDLSADERARLAAHLQTCAACAERVQRYQFIEAFAGDLLHYDLLARSERFRRPSKHKTAVSGMLLSENRKQSGNKLNPAMVWCLLPQALCLTRIIVKKGKLMIKQHFMKMMIVVALLLTLLAGIEVSTYKGAWNIAPMQLFLASAVPPPCW